MTTLRSTTVAILLASTLFGACRETPRPSVLIITVDTLRADHLGAYGDPESVTPNLDELARSATLFERAIAPMPMTRPSHFSMLTSKYPREHGVINNSISLPTSAVSLAEIMNSAGYWTAAFVGVQLLSLKSGATQGFDLYKRPKVKRERNAEGVVWRALRWIGNLPEDAEFFVWVHLFDPHMPYSPPEDFWPVENGQTTSFDWDLLRQTAIENRGDIPAPILAQARSLYRGEVAFADHWIGELIEGVAEKFDLDETLIVFTADHGECFENGIFFEHANCLSEQALRIPLVVRFPRDFPPGQRVATQVSILDIAPTILRAADLEIPSDFSGLPLQDEAGFENRPILIQHPFYRRELFETLPDSSPPMESVAGEPVAHMTPDRSEIGLVEGDWKYLRSPDSEVLIRLGGEGSEEKDVTGEHPDLEREMSVRLQELLALHPQLDLPPTEIDAELRATLKALGYLN